MKRRATIQEAACALTGPNHEDYNQEALSRGTFWIVSAGLGSFFAGAFLWRGFSFEPLRPAFLGGNSS
jgi:hypothetical protein